LPRLSFPRSINLFLPSSSGCRHHRSNAIVGFLVPDRLPIGHRMSVHLLSPKFLESKSGVLHFKLHYLIEELPSRQDVRNPSAISTEALHEHEQDFHQGFWQPQ
jgi:hypothetical protein